MDLDENGLDVDYFIKLLSSFVSLTPNYPHDATLLNDNSTTSSKYMIYEKMNGLSFKLLGALFGGRTPKLAFARFFQIKLLEKETKLINQKKIQKLQI